MAYKVIFFGSFQHHSVSVLKKLQESFDVLEVVTVPPMPAGRNLELKPTEVETYAKSQNLPLSYLVPSTHSLVPDFIIVAGYGKLLPNNLLSLPKIMAINMHPSLLPNYPGRFPAEWAILNGETETGISLIKMNEKFDKGELLVQEKLPISDTDTREDLYTKLFALGADTLVQALPKIAVGEIQPTPQPKVENLFNARQLTREDGYIEYEKFKNFLDPRNSDLEFIKKWRALFPWPGVWTTDPEGKRIKLIDPYKKLIQYEGKTPSSFKI